MTDDPNRTKPILEPKKVGSRRAKLARVLFSVAEAARMLGQRPDTLRRNIERHSVVENDEFVARLNYGIIARRRKDLGRWSVHVPRALFGGEG